MEPGKLHFTIGLPRSGKSTFCQEWVTKPEARVNPDGEIIVTRPRVVISGDSIRLALHGKEYAPLSEGFVFANMDVTARAMLNSGYDVMIDETSTSYETIKRYFRIDIDAVSHLIDVPVETCIYRAVKDGRDYLVEPIKRMHNQLILLKFAWDTLVGQIKHEIRSRKIQDQMV